MRWLVLVALVPLLCGCSTTQTEKTKEDLEKKGIEVHHGQVLRVFKF